MTELKTHAQVRGERNCPTCRGTGVRDCSGSILYDNDGMVRSSSSATTPCHCAKAEPAVPDDVAEMIRRARATPLYEGSGEDSSLAEDMADALEAQAAELARMREALGPFAAVAEHDIGDDETDGEAFRPMQFVNRAPKLTVGDLRRARAALTHPTGDRTNGI